MYRVRAKRGVECVSGDGDGEFEGSEDTSGLSSNKGRVLAIKRRRLSGKQPPPEAAAH